MNPISSLVFVLLLTVFPTQILCQTALMEQACRYTTYKLLCLETLAPDPEAQSATDLKTLVKVSLKYTENQALDIDNKILQLIKSATGDVKPVLNNCSDKYLIVVEKIQAAEASLGYNDVAGAKTWLKDATTNRNMCDEGFKGKPFKSPISDMTTKLGQMQSNAESIIAHI
ncbi:pectinesterase inhibitor 3-like [Quercus lobata]|uniref:pectinesterase inhibitor 3-like n=1 Tax=Quercus lobata TaxID=97700 RepID=UPI0012483999|nr:pectinesterase inhibitor 3-like [Quercus lobata]